MSDCSRHSKEVAGIDDMEALAEMIGDLHYGTLEMFLLEFAEKLRQDSVKDGKAGKAELSKALSDAQSYIFAASVCIKKAWQISKPFMQDQK